MKQTTRLAWGLLLMLAGALFLLYNFGIIRHGHGFLVSVLFALGGLGFLVVFLTDRDNWWAAIPGFVLLGLAALIGSGELFPRFSGAWGGSLFLGGISLSFWAIYLTHRENWWAVIPGGVLLTLASIAGLSVALPGADLGGVFFLGLACTFGLLYLLPTPEGRMRWALIPAGVLFGIAALITAASQGYLRFIMPAALILAGLYLVYRTLRAPRA